MTTTVVPMESVARTALLGVRLWDPVSAIAVSDHIVVTETMSGRTARSSPSGVWAFHDLPGLRASSFAASTTAFWASPPQRARLTFEAVDAAGRFLRFRFDAELPHEGLFTPPCVDPAAGAIPLFSSPGRPIVPGFAAVRADLWDAVADAPAAWAVLEIDGVGDAPWQGVADGQGRVLLLCPYPEPRWQGSSPPAGSHALSEQTWPVTFAVRYAPGLAATGAGSPAVPDVCAVLTQPPAVLASTMSPETPLPAQTLSFGRQLTLRSVSRSVLFVLPS